MVENPAGSYHFFYSKTSEGQKDLDSLHPITLLNTDYKLFTGVIAARLKVGLQ